MALLGIEMAKQGLVVQGQRDDAFCKGNDKNRIAEALYREAKTGIVK
jgi:hypothetical protein